MARPWCSLSGFDGSEGQVSGPLAQSVRGTGIRAFFLVKISRRGGVETGNIHRVCGETIGAGVLEQQSSRQDQMSLRLAEEKANHGVVKTVELAA